MSSRTSRAREAVRSEALRPPRDSAPLRAAVIGTGVISKEHLSFLHASDRAEVVGVCDLSAAAADYAARAYGSATSFTDAATMIDQTNPDVVHVLTPPQSHGPLVTLGLESGADVICEKPVSATLAELDALLEVADRTGRRLMESHNYRWNDGIVQVDEALASGAVGTVRDVEVRVTLDIRDPGGRFGDPNLPHPIHAMPAGAIHDLLTHLVYLLLHYTPGVAFDRLAAGWSNHGGGDLFRFDDLDALLIGSGPDGAVHGRLRFDAVTAPDTFTVKVRGTEGMAETDLYRPHLRLQKARPGGEQLGPIVDHVANGVQQAVAGARNFRDKLLQHGPYVGLHRMLDLAYDALQRDVELPVTVADMRGAAELIDRLLDERVRW